MLVYKRVCYFQRRASYSSPPMVSLRLAAQIAQCAGAKSVAVLSWYNAQAASRRWRQYGYSASYSYPVVRREHFGARGNHIPYLMGSRLELLRVSEASNRSAWKRVYPQIQKNYMFVSRLANFGYPAFLDKPAF